MADKREKELSTLFQMYNKDSEQKGHNIDTIPILSFQIQPLGKCPTSNSILYMTKWRSGSEVMRTFT